MKTIELFAGTRSFSAIAELRGHEVFCVDWAKLPGIDLNIDIEELTTTHLPYIPDFVWLSPDCTTYSPMGLPFHRKGILPVSEYAKKCDRVNENVVKLLGDLLKINPKMIFAMENPVGAMRRMFFVKNIPRATVWYCKYGDAVAKPTDIFTNNLRSLFVPEGWQPRPRCRNSNEHCHHEKTTWEGARKIRTGTNRRPNKYARGKIPPALITEILRAAEQKFTL